MIWMGIGTVVGIVLGLTGSGGGLIAIPLFISWAGLSIKTATVYSLLAVLLGAFFNWIPQRKLTMYPVAIGTFIFSLPSAWLAKSWKASMPESSIAIMLMVIALFSLYKVWRGKNAPHEAGKSFDMKKDGLKTIIAGLILGALTTLTGLGGGVLLVPLFLGFLHLSYDKAVATSLLTITLASLGSLAIQYEKVVGAGLGYQMLYLVGGIVFSTFIVNIVTRKIPAAPLLIIKKGLFTLIVVWAGFSLFA